MKSFAIVIVGYNRLQGLKRLLKSLENVDYDGRNDIHLIFSIDHSGDTKVEDYAKEYTWPYGEKHIRTFNKRQGLKKHILSCGDYTNKYDIVAILEDDLYVSDSFYNYAYQAASYYYDDDRIAGISLYNFQKNWLNWLLRFEPQQSKYDTYFLKVAQSWGQIWTKNKWMMFKKWYETNSSWINSDNIPNYLNTWPETSWLKYHDRYCIETDKYFVYPYVSISTNYSDAGEHSKKTSTDHQVELMYGKKKYKCAPLSEKAICYDEYMNRMNLGKYLNISEDELCVDFWGTKPKTQYKKYLLSLDSKDYAIIKEYELSLRPIELSIINNIQGEGIRLYDTTRKASNGRRKPDGQYSRYLYSIRSTESKKIIGFAIKLRFNDIISRGISKINKRK